jgi:hypothetical protein
MCVAWFVNCFFLVCYCNLFYTLFNALLWVRRMLHIHVIVPICSVLGCIADALCGCVRRRVRRATQGRRLKVLPKAFDGSAEGIAQQLKLSFMAIDFDNSGTIDRGEFVLWATSLAYQPLSRAEASVAFELWDADGSKTIDEDEFAVMFSPVLQAHHMLHEKQQDAWNRSDVFDVNSYPRLVQQGHFWCACTCGLSYVPLYVEHWRMLRAFKKKVTAALKNYLISGPDAVQTALEMENRSREPALQKEYGGAAQSNRPGFWPGKPSFKQFLKQKGGELHEAIRPTDPGPCFSCCFKPKHVAAPPDLRIKITGGVAAGRTGELAKKVKEGRKLTDLKMYKVLLHGGGSVKVQGILIHRMCDDPPSASTHQTLEEKLDSTAMDRRGRAPSGGNGGW